jgi:uncharacterized protein YegP (UPF0339 family)
MAHPVRAFQWEDLHFYLYVDIDGRYQWQLFAGDDYELGHSSEGYLTQADCVYAVELLANRAIPLHFAGSAEINPI